MKRVLAIGPHPDDVELGCFGTLLKYKNLGYEIHILVLTQGEGGSESDRSAEAKKSASLMSCCLYIENLPDRYISEGVETIQLIEKYVKEIKPDVVFIPSGNDTHQDHRATNRASIVACRQVSELYTYQSPSTTYEFKPNFYVDISDYIDIKLRAVQIHTSQGSKVYMADKAISGLAEYRAFDVLRNGRFFEAFEVNRIIID